MINDDDDEGPDFVEVFAFVFLVCVSVLMISGTAYAIHRIIAAW